MAPRANWKGFLRLSLVTCPVALFELSLKVGDGGNRKGGISWGCLTPPLLHRRSDMPCPMINTGNTCGPPTRSKAPSPPYDPIERLSVEQDRARDSLQTGRGRAEKLASSRWPQPVAKTR